MTLREISEQWFGKTLPYPNPDPYKLQGQCVQFIRYLLDVYYKKPQWVYLGEKGGAWEFWNRYETDSNMNKHFIKIPNSPEFIPQEGDIVIWSKAKGNGDGHIAVVYGMGQTVNRMICLEQNWKPKIVSVESHDYKDVLGFFRVREGV